MSNQTKNKNIFYLLKISKTILISCIVIFVVSINNFFSYFFPTIYSIDKASHDFLPMAPTTAISLILLSISLFLLNSKYAYTKPTKIYSYAIAILTGSFGLHKTLDYIFNLNLNFENLFIPVKTYIEGFPIGLMSPLTGLIFFLSSINLFFLLIHKTSKIKCCSLKPITIIQSYGILIISILALLSHIYGKPILLTTREIIPMSFSTSILFIIIALLFINSFAPKRKLSITLKFIGSYIFIFIFFISLIVLIYQNIIKLSDTAHTLFEHPLKVTKTTAVIESDIHQINQLMQMAADTNSFTELSSIITTITGLDNKIENNFNIIQNAILGYEGQLLSANTHRKYFDWKQIRLNNLNNIKQGKYEEAILSNKSVEKKYLEILQDNFNDIRTYTELKAHNFLLESKDENKLTLNTIIKIILFAGFIGTSAFLLLSLSIVKRLSRINTAATKIARGDLEQFIKIEGHDELDELAENFNIMTKKLSKSYNLLEGEVIIKDNHLRYSENKYQRLFENMVDAFAYHKMLYNQKGEPIDYIFLECNKEFEKQTGLQRKNILGKTVSTVIPELKKDKTDWIKLYGDVATNGEPKKFESFSKPLNNWYSISVYSPMKGYFATIFENITEKRNSQQKIIESEKKFKMIFDSSPEVLVFFDTNGKIIDINNIVTSWLGYKKEYFLNKNLLHLNILYKEDKEKVIQSFTQRIKGKDIPPYEIKFIAKDHSIKIGRIIGTQLKDNKGKVIGELIIISDITEKITAENKLKQAFKDLKELDKLKDNFLNISSHELKTPLIPIRTQTELLLDNFYGKINKKQEKALKMILRNEGYMYNLANDILDIAKVKSKKMVLIFNEINFENLLNETVLHYKELAQNKNIELFVEPIPSLPKISLDKRRITQVISNLLDNALKFTPKNGKIIIEVKKIKKYISVSISDSGIGIENSELKKIFDFFYQANSNITRKYGGTGLGLSICQGIIQGHNGTIKAKSQINKGSTFTFTLPIK